MLQNGDSSEILYIGRDNSNYYKGKIDEVGTQLVHILNIDWEDEWIYVLCNVDL